MPFNSIIFLCFFLLFTVIYYSVAGRQAKLWLLLAGSYVFYAYGNLFNLLCLLLITTTTVYIAFVLKRNRDKFVLVLGIMVILGLLIATKYSGFIARRFSLTTALGPASFGMFILPVGISFYSLQAISLLVDSYKARCVFNASWKTVPLFLSFFPQAVAGPIHRAGELIPQFEAEKRFDTANIILGAKIMLWGYFCKLMVADKISLVITPVLDTYFRYDGLSLIIASLLYSWEIYFDFWGYSLIAIGVGRVLGYSINNNFAYPYNAKSFRDFWHRWHITLSRWMRDYIYLPLGGRNRKGYQLFCAAIFVTFLVSGFWHGISVNFILWGAIHAVLYLTEDFLRKWCETRVLPTTAATKISRNMLWSIFFFMIISATWLVFRTGNMQDLLAMLKKMFNWQHWTTGRMGEHYLTVTNSSYLAIALLTVLLSHSRIITNFTTQLPADRTRVITDSLVMSLCLFLIILLGDIGGKEFLYFNF